MGWGSAPSTDTGTEIPTTATTRPLDSWNNRILALELALALVLALVLVLAQVLVLVLVWALVLE